MRDYDPVDHPRHYNIHPSGVECIQIAEHLNFCLGNAMKYIWRAGEKEGTNAVEDLRKAAWYLNREIERREIQDAKARSIQKRQQSRIPSGASTAKTGEQSVSEPRAGTDSTGAEPVPHREEARRDLHGPDICTVHADFCRETHEDATPRRVDAEIR